MSQYIHSNLIIATQDNKVTIMCCQFVIKLEHYGGSCDEPITIRKHTSIKAEGYHYNIDKVIISFPHHILTLVVTLLLCPLRRLRDLIDGPHIKIFPISFLISVSFPTGL